MAATYNQDGKTYERRVDNLTREVAIRTAEDLRHRGYDVIAVDASPFKYGIAYNVAKHKLPVGIDGFASNTAFHVVVRGPSGGVITTYDFNDEMAAGRYAYLLRDQYPLAQGYRISVVGRRGQSLGSLSSALGGAAFGFHRGAPHRGSSRLGDLDPDTLDQLTQMAAESSDCPNARDAHATPAVHRAADSFKEGVRRVLAAFIRTHPTKDGSTADDIVNDRLGVYLVYVTLEGHGVGTWDGRWDHLWDRDDIEEFNKLAKARLSGHIKSGKYRHGPYSRLQSEIDHAGFKTGGCKE